MSNTKNRRMWIIVIGIILIMIIVVGIILWQYFALQSSIVIAEDDFFAFNPVDSLSGVDVDDVNCTEYNVDISEMDAEEIEDLLYSDFTAEAVKGDIDLNDQFSQDTDYIQVFFLDHDDYEAVWVMSPVLGGETVYMMNRTSDLNGIAYETDGGSFVQNQTTDREWTYTVKASDVGIQGTGVDDEDYEKGLPGANYDFVNNVFNFNVIRIQYNTTAAHTYSEITGNYDELVNGTYSYFYFLDDWTNEDFSDYLCKFSAGLGDTFEVLNVGWGYGNLDSAITIYDTQA